MRSCQAVNLNLSLATEFAHDRRCHYVRETSSRVLENKYGNLGGYANLVYDSCRHPKGEGNPAIEVASATPMPLLAL